MADRMAIQDKAYIGGRWVAGNQGCFEVDDPACGEVVARVANVDLDQVEQAIDAASEAFESWRMQPAQARCDRVMAWQRLLLAQQSRLAELITLESGKPMSESMAEVAYGASYLKWFAEQGVRAYGQTLPALAGGRRPMTIKQPVGVVAIITPWNFPLAMIARKVAPALAAGCCVVIKPAAETPLTALALVALAEQAGFPAGCINVVPSTDAAGIGQRLCASTKVRKLSFTGSTAVGRILMAQSAAQVQKVSLELGGNAPFIVFDDADLDSAVAGLMAAKFRNSGQTCVAANRVLVQQGVYEAFVDKVRTKVLALKVGPGAIEGNDIGPLITLEAHRRVSQLVERAVAAGATVSAVGTALPGRFYPPTLLESIRPCNPIWQQEIFGPVLAVSRFDTEEEAVELANSTESGLASYLYSDNVRRVMRVAESLEFGMVGINEGIISAAVAPFGGVKSSGLGREGGQEGLDDYLETKYLCFGH
ncbi:succinate-semialdehyde dehydrogenase / glutarate-semialdehyde dehydrogenase [Ferrimonas sediminum]|uniref:Succinate-semialdehyde dehydrogenase / glutarate-semialdehyde dehydrogenase n=1 Tax=Ferrimonas sediminum TaxID=718193 RepID=A0A1G9BYD9_9GAMM|nr:NAD-dependent succinate-semialdehyde dehydrogenase [Ferrimonas sediminum]SDK44468.1 succinate-semialdehyde dehydrogenase / glutarate-semialdehyde dehydrogenase [Ferrimonas sediminum]